MATVICTGCDWHVTIAMIVPDACPKCGGTHWRTAHDPAQRYELSENDRRLLRALRIAPEV